MAKFFIYIGLLFLLIGFLLYIFIDIKYFPRLPGDIYIKNKNFTFYFPVTTSILLSIILSLILYFLRK